MMVGTRTRHADVRLNGKFNRQLRGPLGAAAAVLHLGVRNGQLVTDRLQ